MMRLLIVEDEARIAELIQAALARAGFAIDAVHLCADARAVLETTSYDAAIVDFGLPDGDGLRLLGELRTKGNPTPVLVLTAATPLRTVFAGSTPGCNHCRRGWRCVLPRCISWRRQSRAPS
jgi:DNA-binding response OmpR family regulator